MLGFGLSFKNSRLDPDRKILQSTHLCNSPPEVALAGFSVFPSDADKHPKFFEKPGPDPVSLLNFGSSRKSA